MNEFLKIEYQACLDLLKYYDERHLSLVKFTTSVSSSVVSLVFAFYTLSSEAHQYFWHFAAVLSGVAGVGLLALFAGMVQNRLYFIYPARQINAIRRTMLGKLGAEFSDNQMYLTTDVRPFKFLSVHTLMNFLVVLQVSAFFVFSWFAMTVDPANVGLSLLKASIATALTSCALFGLAALYLTRRGRYHPDRAVHFTKEPD